jgi:phenylacetate-coenzyme A ligase PaaK-like adenylate-forming protein
MVVLEIPSLQEVKDAMRMARSKFREHAEYLLKESDVMVRASKSDIYRKLWDGRSYRPDLDDALKMPVLTPEFYTGFPERDPKIPSGPVERRADGWDGWLCSTGSRKMKFFPFSDYDAKRLGTYQSRYAMISELSKGDAVINVGAEPPHCSLMMSEMASAAYGLDSIPVTRGIMGKPQELMGNLMKKSGSIVGLTGVPLIGIRFLNTMAKEIPRPLKQVFPNLRMAVMAGETMNENQRKAFGKFDIEGYEMYASAELAAAAVDCRRHKGPHLFLDDNVYILKTDAGKKYLWDCEKGDIGELFVITPNREGFPLVNYAMKDVVEVIDTECACGITAPNVRIISRTDDVLNIGGAKAYERHIEEKFEEVGRDHVIPDWQIHWSKDNNGNTDYHTFDILIDNGELDARTVEEAILESFSKDPRTEQLYQAQEAEILKLVVEPLSHKDFQERAVNASHKRVRIVKKF